MSLSPFDVMKMCFTKKPHLSNEELSGYSQWMMGKIMSNDQSLVFLACELSKPMDDRMHYDCLYHGLPEIDNKGKGKYIPWNCTKPKKEQEIQYLMEHFQVNQTTAKMYHELISKEEMQYIIFFFENRGVKK